MKAPETDLEGWSDGMTSEIPGEDTPEGGLLETSEYATAVSTPGAVRPSLWDALVGYWSYGEHPAPSSLREGGGRWLLDEDDFSSEHGYETGFEGRSEFEHGEFDRWT